MKIYTCSFYIKNNNPMPGLLFTWIWEAIPGRPRTEQLHYLLWHRDLLVTALWTVNFYISLCFWYTCINVVYSPVIRIPMFLGLADDVDAAQRKKAFCVQKGGLTASAGSAWTFATHHTHINAAHNGASVHLGLGTMMHIKFLYLFMLLFHHARVCHVAILVFYCWANLGW